MTTIVVLFNLKPETVLEDYENWAQTVDIPNVRRLPGGSGAGACQPGASEAPRALLHGKMASGALELALESPKSSAVRADEHAPYGRGPSRPVNLLHFSES